MNAAVLGRDDGNLGAIVRQPNGVSAGTGLLVLVGEGRRPRGRLREVLSPGSAGHHQDRPEVIDAHAVGMFVAESEDEDMVKAEEDALNAMGEEAGKQAFHSGLMLMTSTNAKERVKANMHSVLSAYTIYKDEYNNELDQPEFVADIL